MKPGLNRRDTGSVERWALYRLEPDEGKLSRPVLRGGGDRKVISSPKNREARAVDLNAELRAVLEDMETRKAPDCAWLFPSPQRGERDEHARTFRESLLLTREAAGLPDFGFHDLRRFFASRAVMSGIDFLTVSRWLGHKDGGILLGKSYAHLANEHRKAAAKKLVFAPVLLASAS